MTTPIRFGILGAARIAPRALIVPATEGTEAVISCVAARDPERARAFAEEHNIPRVHTSYADVVEDDEIDVVYNPLPMHLHRHWTIESLRAGKHVLCEKPFAANAAEAQEMVDVAQQTGLFLMEAFHYRYHPLFERILKVVSSGALGTVQRLSGTFNVAIPNREDLRQRWDTAGGATMDLGCYPIHWMRTVMGTEPKVLRAQATEGARYVDVRMEAELEFPGGVKAQYLTCMEDDEAFCARLEIEGEKGRLLADNPLAPHAGHRLELNLGGHTQEETVEGPSTYRAQLIAFAEAFHGTRQVPTMGENSVANMRVIDAIYTAAGLPVRGTEPA